MATTASLTEASDELCDFPCTPCNKKEKNSEANAYCVDCEEYLCANCVDSHNSFSMLAGHTLVGRSKNGLIGSGCKKLPSVPTERCRLHSLKLVDMYCASHDAVGCHVCFTIMHKACEDIHYIPEYVQTKDLTNDSKKTKAELEKAIIDMELILKKKLEEIENNKKTKAGYLEDLKHYRKEINEIVDRLEEASIINLDKTFEKLKDDNCKNVKLIRERIRQLASRKANIDTSQNNKSQNFVNVKLSECLLSDKDKEKIDMACLEDRLIFERNPEILIFLQDLDSLANFTSKVHILYKKINRTIKNVKINDDKKVCSIWSICALDSGDLLLADWENKTIKLADHRYYHIEDSLKMSDRPYSVCRISDEEAAIGLSNKTLQFVSTKSFLTKTRSLTFDHSCRGLAVLDGQLLMGNDGDKIYIYSMNGECLKVIETNQIGNKLFSYIRELCVSNNGKMIHVSDRHRGVITLDIDGKVLWQYAGQELKCPWGISTDETGCVIVSGTSSRNVVQLGPDGKFFGEIVSQECNLKYPKAVFFDRKHFNVIIPDGNELKVFTIQRDVNRL